jgi:mannose-6-phosphate isomerase
VLGTGAPKTETWYLIDAAPGACLYKGLRAGAGERDVRAALRDGTVADLLVKVPVAAGECHHIPAGAVHAIGPGILIAEVQTPSDTTFRLFDWNRRDAAGKSRALHVEEALANIRWDLPGSWMSATTHGRLVACEHYVVDKRLGGPGEPVRIGGAGLPTVIMVVGGSGTIRGPRAQAVGFHTGDTLLIPAAFEGRAEFDCACVFLETSIPG